MFGVENGTVIIQNTTHPLAKQSTQHRTCFVFFYVRAFRSQRYNSKNECMRSEGLTMSTCLTGHRSYIGRPHLHALQQHTTPITFDLQPPSLTPLDPRFVNILHPIWLVFVRTRCAIGGEGLAYLSGLSF